MNPIYPNSTHSTYRRTLALMLLMSVPFAGRGQTTPTKADFTFGGRLVVAVSDADMVASAYLDGHLGPLQGQDALLVIRLGKPVSQLTAVAIGASNPLTGLPSSVAVSPDGRYVVVIETRGTRPTGKADPQFADLPPGKVVTVIDLPAAYRGPLYSFGQIRKWQSKPDTAPISTVGNRSYFVAFLIDSPTFISSDTLTFAAVKTTRG